MAPPTLQAVTFDVFNTLLYLDSPFLRLQENFRNSGYPLPLAAVAAALRREMRYYARRSPLVATPAGLADLRRNSAQVLLDALAEQGYPLPLSADSVVPLLLDSLHFVLFPEVPAVLSALAQRGLRLGVVSNWDISLPEVLARLQVLERFDLVLPAALAGCAKPDPALFREAAARLGLPPQAILHIGDSYQQDVVPARRAGLQARLLRRDGAARREEELQDLTEVLELCRGSGPGFSSGAPSPPGNGGRP
jgi:FMN phosphatase YigB (HAD superfamily)